LDSTTLLEQNEKLRNQFWSNIGKIDEKVISTIINPAFQGQMTWPNMHELYIVIRTKNRNIISTDGFSEFTGLELYTETFEKDPANGWAREFVRQVSLNACPPNSITPTLDKYGIFSMEVYDVPVPSTFISKDERIGLLVGMNSSIVPDKLSINNSGIQYVSLTLLTLAELEYITVNGTSGRTEVINRLKEKGYNAVSDITRKSVI